MTQFELAKSLGFTSQAVNAIELDKYPPSLEVVFKIAAMFDLHLEQVFQSRQ
ncbi:MAG: helix-turn-helix transcriptional regulator [Pseudohongiellaceae bacterium]|tara:strand:+ start:58 stop:213 length:156 start_codon:yes stop_codon:yes gene_type:complete